MVAFLYITAAMLDGVSVGLVLPFLSVISGGAADLESHRFLGILTGALERVGIPFALGPLLVIIGVAVLLRTLTQFVGSMLLVRVTERMLVKLRVKLLDNLLHVAPRYHGTTKAGELAQTILDDVEKTGLAVSFAFKLLSGVAMLAVWILLMLLFSWQLTALSVGVAGVLTLLVRYRITRSARLGSRIAEAKRSLSSMLIEVLSGVRVIWLSSTESQELQRIQAHASEVGTATYQFQRNSAIVNVVGENFGSAALLGIVYLSVTRFHVDMATLVAFFFVLSRVLPQSHRMNVVRTELAGYLAHASNVLGLLSHEDKPYIRDGSKELAMLQRDVVLDDVWFEHRAEDPVLRGVSLALRRGQTVALAGASGAGKSTIVDLLARFHEPLRGEIRVDGIPLSELKIATWRRRLGVVSQDVFLFSDTIAANISYGACHLEPSDIEDAARMANAHQFISELPDGYRTMLGERGATLSGGQRQRIALARALARRPHLLILDEATSALDAESERLILDAIERLSGHVAILVIGHRLATLRKADTIYVLEAGAIVESGTHQELVASGGLYARYCELQQV